MPRRIRKRREDNRRLPQHLRPYDPEHRVGTYGQRLAIAKELYRIHGPWDWERHAPSRP